MNWFTDAHDANTETNGYQATQLPSATRFSTETTTSPTAQYQQHQVLGVHRVPAPVLAHMFHKLHINF